ncbi:MAG: hypothetical protein ACP5IK_02320 [Candidatus Micrarchaeia archaeon]
MLIKKRSFSESLESLGIDKEMAKTFLIQGLLNYSFQQQAEMQPNLAVKYRELGVNAESFEINTLKSALEKLDVEEVAKIFRFIINKQDLGAVLEIYSKELKEMIKLKDILHIDEDLVRAIDSLPEKPNSRPDQVLTYCLLNFYLAKMATGASKRS